MLCARECPDWCIYIDSHKETIPAPPGAARPRQRNVLDRFDIDFSLCMYCGICIEVCPFDALFWSPEFEYAELDIRDLTHEQGPAAASGWPPCPPPPAHDPHGEPPKEVDAAEQGHRDGAPRRPRDVPARATAAASGARRGQPGDRRGRCRRRALLGVVAVALRAAGRDHAPTWCTPALWLVVTLGAVAGLLPGARRRVRRLGAGADLRRRGRGAAAVRR